MIDCESEIFGAVAQKVRAIYPGMYMTGEYIRAPASFPCVSIEEKNNAVWRNSRDTSSNENHVTVMYEINVYSNKRNGRKAECKAIASVVDDAMKSLGFTRTMLNPIPNLADATIYRMTGRYTAIIEQDANGDFVIYKR